MLSPEEIAEQQQLLAVHRHTLAIYLKQQAMIGRAYSPPALINGIEEARLNIKRLKATLRAANVEVPNDPDDESSTGLFSTIAEAPAHLLPTVAEAPAHLRSRPAWPWLVAIGIVALALIIGGWWWFNTQMADTVLPTETSLAEETTPSLEEATAAGETLPPEGTPTTDVAALESQLMDANIALSDVQVEQVREFISDPETGYKLLAEHALQVVGDQKFRDTLYLDELDTRYTELVGTEQYAEFNEDKLKEAMVRAWNGHYTDRQAELFEEIVEPRP